MSDIVERLREAARNAQVIEQHGILSLAADEIERLRAEVKKALPASKRDQMHMVMDGAIAAMKAIKESKP